MLCYTHIHTHTHTHTHTQVNERPTFEGFNMGDAQVYILSVI
jgi:hypothetical protein